MISKELPILNLARAVAACWVMAAHISLIGGKRVFLLSQGSLGVEVFIFISGFLMTLILQDESNVSRAGVTRFYIRRFFRIAPAFYAALILYIGFRGMYIAGIYQAESFFSTPYRMANLDGPLSWSCVLLNALFLHGLSPTAATGVFGPAWSLSLEMQFYALAPFLVFAFRRAPFLTLGILWAANFFGNLAFGVYGQRGWIVDFTFPSFLPNRIFLFFLGASFCVYLFQRERRNLVLLLLALVAVFPLVGVKSALVCLVLTGVLYFAITARGRWRGIWTAIADSPVTRHLSDWSYGIYLLHMFCMSVVGHALRWGSAFVPPALIFPSYAIAVVALALFAAALFYRFIEAPARNFGKLLGRSLLAAEHPGH